MDNNQDITSNTNPQVHDLDNSNSNFLRRSITNTSNVLKRTFTVSSKSVDLFTNVFQYDESVVIKDVSDISQLRESAITRRPTKQELYNINKDIEYLVN